jgi:hypothetical protein
MAYVFSFMEFFIRQFQSRAMRNLAEMAIRLNMRKSEEKMNRKQDFLDGVASIAPLDQQIATHSGLQLHIPRRSHRSPGLSLARPKRRLHGQWMVWMGMVQNLATNTDNRRRSRSLHGSHSSIQLPRQLLTAHRNWHLGYVAH